MGRCTNYVNYANKDYNSVIIENDKLKAENKSLKLRITLLEDENRRLKLEADKNKIHNDLDCTCSSIPSSKSGFKKGISNNRKPSNKKVGGQENHKAHYLKKSKIDKLLENPKTKKVKTRINYTKRNKNKQPIIRYKIGYEIIPVVYEYEIYPDEFGKYNIPKELHSQVQYADEVKTLAMSLYYDCNVSTDNVKSFLENIFDYKPSKGSVVNWEKELEKNLRPETGHILRCLMKEKFDHVDDSPINVCGETFNVHNVSSNTHTMQWVHKNKGHNAIEEIGFIPRYNGTLVKDGHILMINIMMILLVVAHISVDI